MKNALSRSLWLVQYSVGWLPFFLLYVLAMYASTGEPLAVGVVQTAFYLGPGYFLGIAVWWYANRISGGGHRWGRYFGLHLFGGSVYTVLWHLVFFGLLWLINGGGSLNYFDKNRIVWMVLTGLMVYGLLAGLSSIDRLSEQVRERELNAAKAESLRVRAEMEGLRGQLDPHFLFNTLHSITALVREDSARAEEALLAFGELLRHVIATKRDGLDELPLREEIAFVDRYLELEKLRLGGRLAVERDCSSDALECWIPCFTVQPLVENAIRHAIAPHRQGGKVSISAKVQARRLMLVVADNGPGGEPEDWTQSKGVGLPVVRQRLELRHPGQAGVTVETAPGQGFRVTLSLPAVHNAVVETVA